MPWWIEYPVQVIGKNPLNPKVVEAPTRPKADTQQAGVVTGPYATEADAEAQLSGLHKEGGVPPGIPNPLSGLAAIAAALAKAVGYLGDLAMWRSLGWLVLGAILMIAGIWLWAKQQGLTPKAPTIIPLPV